MRNDAVGQFSLLIMECMRPPHKEHNYQWWRDWLISHEADLEARQAFQRAWMEYTGKVVDLEQYRNRRTKKANKEIRRTP